MKINKTYIHVYPPSVWRANGQPLMQHNGSYTMKNFYLSDRLGSVREAFIDTGAVNGYSTYGPFGETLESNAAIGMVASFRFTGQYYDSDTGQYYLRARQYAPYLYRFTSRDPVFGKFEEPMTLHKYLYCQNNPVNKLDPKGEFPWIAAGGALTVGAAFYALHHYWDYFDIQGLSFGRIQDIDIQKSIARSSTAYDVLSDLQKSNHGITTLSQLKETLESKGVYGVGLFGCGVVGEGHKLPYGQRKIISHFEDLDNLMKNHPDIFMEFPKPYEYSKDPAGWMERQIEAELKRMEAVITELNAEYIRRLTEE
ncbi:MAG: RHS repeat-associated core domain-containing protein [Phycisphaerae bacterium]|nr:RHS repeat-associated core domain-containing protein [Phycisphaerae bacterium]MDD5381416.1 RHS repeat-associated core domain-containing protein [Phycisphaerae bacterium]